LVKKKNSITKRVFNCLATKPLMIEFGFMVTGSWLHSGYHLTTSMVSPALLSLPFALALLGWAGGLIGLIVAGLVTFYSYNLLSMVLEHHARLGHRQLRYRDMATDILG